jgi:hypothetical protein
MEGQIHWLVHRGTDKYKILLYKPQQAGDLIIYINCEL